MTQRYNMSQNPSQTSGYSSFVSNSQCIDPIQSQQSQNQKCKIRIESPDLYTRYLRSCAKKKSTTESSPDIASLMDKVDGIYSKVENVIQSVRESEQHQTVSLIAAVEKVVTSFEEKLESLNARISDQQEMIAELMRERKKMVTEGTQTEGRCISEAETQTPSPYRELIERPVTRMRTRTYSENLSQKRKAEDQSLYYKNNKMPRHLNYSLTIPRQSRQNIRCEGEQPSSVLRAMQQKRFEERFEERGFLSKDANYDSLDESDMEIVERPRDTFEHSKNMECIFDDFEPAQHSTPIKTPSSEVLSAKGDMYRSLQQTIFPTRSQNISVFVDSSDSD